MNRRMRHTGVESLGAVPWGTHFCQFYQTPQEWLELLIDYFRRGLQDNESCIWVTSDPLGTEEACRALAGVVPDLDACVRRGQIEFQTDRQWYLPDGRFDPERVLHGWIEKERAALARGFDGLRVAASMSWLDNGQWKAFTDYEATVNKTIGSLRLLTFCACSLERCSGDDVLDVLRNHPLAVVKRENRWEVMLSPQQRKLEETLRTTEQKYHWLFDNNLDGVILSTADGIVTDANPAACAMLGMSKEEIVAAGRAGVIDSSDSRVPVLLEERERAGAVRGEITLIRKDGSKFPADLSSVIAERAEGHSHAFTIISDITARKRVESALAAERDLACRLAAARETDEIVRICLEAAIETSGLECGGIYVIDPTSGAMQIVHHTGLGSEFIESVASVRAGSVEERLLQQGQIVEVSRSRFEELGQVAAIREGLSFILAIPVGYEGRAIACVNLASRTVIAIPTHARAALQAVAAQMGAAIVRAQAQESLRLSEDRLHFALEVSGAGAWDLNLVDHAVHRSARHDRIFGYESPRPDWTYETFLRHVVPEERETVDRQVRQAVASGNDCSFECRIRRVDGQIRWIWVAGRHRADSSGKLTRMAGFTQDITDRKRVEQEKLELERRLLHAQKLESLGVLAGGIAHDFNNILAGIRLFAESLQAEQGNSTAAHERLGQIKKATRHGADLTRQILTYAGKAVVDPQPLDLSQIVDGMKTMLAVISRKAVLQCDLPSGLPATLADAGQIGQVVMNLAVNAAEALGDEGGVIAISTSATEVDDHDAIRGVSGESLPPGRYVRLEVADTGCGMDQATLDKIFEPFFTTKFAGRGLGLATVHGIVRSHRGAIQITSRPGEGSTFRVYLPATDAPAAAPTPREPKTATRRQATGTVLVVDDEPIVRKGTQIIFESSGFQVLTAGDGQEALDVYRRHREKIVCVILDLTMPKKSGEETFHELRRIDPNLKIVLTSGYPEETVMRRFAGEAVFGFVQKPEPIDDMIAKLQEALAGID